MAPGPRLRPAESSGKVEGQQNGEPAPAPGPVEPAVPSDATASGTAGSHPSDQIVQKIEEVLSGALETEPQRKSDVDVDADTAKKHTKASELALGSGAVAKMKTLGAVAEFVALAEVKDSKETVKSEVTAESKDREKSNKRTLISETSKVKSLQTVMESKASAEVKLLEASRFEVMSELKDFESVVEQVAIAEATSSEPSLQFQAVAELKASETAMEVQAMAEGKNLTSLLSNVMTEAKELEITPQTEAVVEDKNFETAPKSVAAITDMRYLELRTEFETMPEVKELETVKGSEAVLESETITRMKVPKLLPITMAKSQDPNLLKKWEAQNLHWRLKRDALSFLKSRSQNLNLLKKQGAQDLQWSMKTEALNTLKVKSQDPNLLKK
ncbi:hypothetical protein Y1Q_0003273 [Alligator mississippiensis]|uniref:Uncharacterized protein n=1 Tax=Alligator mississippiensis TaxID=8496 RepID=A0A151ME66_ALLMI|nr:hypothetical protein Y1Q_0003273 [Alligator mississippiensis]